MHKKMSNLKEKIKTNFWPEVTILIPIKNVAKYIGECLDALLNQSYPQDKYRVWLLDNNSDDGTLDIVAKYPKERVKVIQIGVDSPPLKYNKVLPSVKDEIVGFVDGDANVDKEWLIKVIEPLRDPEVAGAGGVILTANKEKFIPRIIGYELQDRYEHMPREVKRLATMHVVYKKSVLEKLGWFNETLKTGYDCEIGYRINDLGYKIIFVPDAKVWHNHRENLYSFFKQQYEYGKFAIIRYLKMPKIFKGDEVTSFRMICQPLFYLAFLILILGVVFFKVPYWIPLVPLLFLFIGFLISVIRLSIKFRTLETFFLIIIYIIRSIGWSLGAMAMIFNKAFKREYRP